MTALLPLFSKGERYKDSFFCVFMVKFTNVFYKRNCNTVFTSNHIQLVDKYSLFFKNLCHQLSYIINCDIAYNLTIPSLIYSFMFTLYINALLIEQDVDSHMTDLSTYSLDMKSNVAVRFKCCYY